MFNVFSGQHLSHIGSSAGITDHGCTAADQCDRLISCHLQSLHQGQRHKMTRRQAVCSTVKADVKGCFSVVDHFTDLFFICHLCKQAPCLQFFINSHFVSSFLFLRCVAAQKKSPPSFKRASSNSRYHLMFLQNSRLTAPEVSDNTPDRYRGLPSKPTRI